MSRYELLAVEGVPALTPEDHNAARRFITLIDVWYDRGKELPPLAASPWTRTASLHASSCEQELHLSSAVPLPQLFSSMHEEGMRASLGSLSTYAQADPVPAATSVRGFGGASAGLTSTCLGGGASRGAEDGASSRLPACGQVDGGRDRVVRHRAHGRLDGGAQRAAGRRLCAAASGVAAARDVGRRLVAAARAECGRGRAGPVRDG